MPATQEEIVAQRLRREAEAQRALERLRKRPDAVIDIGVHNGTPWLYRAFPEAPFLLIDPQLGGERLVKMRPQKFVFVNKAVGRAPGRVTLHEQAAMSTVLQRTPLTSVPTVREYEVEVATLDSLIAAHLPEALTIGLKIDTEGFELEVLAGLNRFLDRIAFIVSEVSILNRFENSYCFSELVGAMWDKGFRFYNLLDDVKRPPPRVYDCIFLRRDDPAFDGAKSTRPAGQA